MTADYEFDCEVVDGRLVVRGDCDLMTARRLSERIAAFGRAGHRSRSSPRHLLRLLRACRLACGPQTQCRAARRRREPRGVMVLKITGTLRYLRGSGDLADVSVVVDAERTAVQLRSDDTDVFERLRLRETAIATASGRNCRISGAPLPRTGPASLNFPRPRSYSDGPRTS